MVPNEPPDQTPPGFHLRSNTCSCIFIVSFEKKRKKLGLCASSWAPNTSEQMKALRLKPHAFICFSVFGILHYVPGARFSKVLIINGPGKLSPFTLKIEDSIVFHLA